MLVFPPKFLTYVPECITFNQHYKKHEPTTFCQNPLSSPIVLTLPPPHYNAPFSTPAPPSLLLVAPSPSSPSPSQPFLPSKDGAQKPVNETKTCKLQIQKHANYKSKNKQTAKSFTQTSDKRKNKAE